jgi:hypothetical protein
VHCLPGECKHGKRRRKEGKDSDKEIAIHNMTRKKMVRGRDGEVVLKQLVKTTLKSPTIQSVQFPTTSGI